jgi:ABC-type sugar transport system substrate-binding protein
MGAQAVYDGQMRYSTLKSQAKMAERALEYTDLLIQKKPITNKVSLVPPVVIVKDTVTTVKDPMFGGTFTAPETFKPKK